MQIMFIVLCSVNQGSERHNKGGCMKSLLIIGFAVCTALAFGVPDVPDVPDADIPDIEIPGMELLDEVQVKLDGLVSQTDELRTLIPDLAALDNVSAKLEELRDTDPEMAELQAEIDALRGELVSAREQITSITDEIDAEVSTIRTTVDQFTEGLPVN